MRYLLRPPSTPWITFDKDTGGGEPALGPLLASSRSSVMSSGVFPELAAPSPSAAPPAEPSNVVVSSDIGVEPAPVSAPGLSAGEIEPAARSGPSGRGRVAAVAAVAMLVGLAAGAAWSASAQRRGALASASESRADRARVSASQAESAVPAPGSGAEPAASQPTPLPPPPPTAEAAEPAPPPEKRGFGRLVVRGAAKHNRVYFDDKLLLGHGKRSFSVFCGEHTIAIGKKADKRDITVPCNGAYVVSK